MERAKAILQLMIGLIIFIIILLVLFSIAPTLLSVVGGHFKSIKDLITFSLIIITTEFVVEGLFLALYNSLFENKQHLGDVTLFIVRSILVFFIILFVEATMTGVQLSIVSSILFAILYTSLTQAIELMIGE